MSSVANLFIDKEQRPSKDQGILDVGKNCSLCNQLDLLPITCEYCKKTFCSQHSSLEKHHCPYIKQFYNLPPPPSRDNTASPTSSVSSKTLFPDRAADRKLLDERLKSPPPPRTIKETQFRVGDVAGTSAFKKLQKFLNKKETSSSNKISSFFGSKDKSSSNKFADLAKLKKEAKGDAKIAAADRIYLWCTYIGDSAAEVENTTRRGVFVSKNWSVGRSLDSIADTLRIRNINNSTTKIEEKLHIFQKETTEEPKLVKTTQKATLFKNGDTIYLVRGVLVE